MARASRGRDRSDRVWRKLRFEEAVMRRQFDEAYARYAERTPALVPFLI